MAQHINRYMTEFQIVGVLTLQAFVNNIIIQKNRIMHRYEISSAQHSLEDKTQFYCYRQILSVVDQAE